MKAFQVLVIVGGILIALGVSFALGAFEPGSQEESFTIPPGDFYYYFEVSILGDGRLSGNFTELAARAVDSFVFTKAQYEQYTTTGVGSPSLWSSSGSSGVFNVALTGSSKYYLVFDHGPGYDAASQQVSLTLQLHGIGLTGFGIGIGLLVVGAILVAVGLWLKRKAGGAPTGEVPKATDVVVFEKPKPPSM